jgi:hypothetical protein
VAVLIAIIIETLLSSRTVVDVDLDYAVSCVQTPHSLLPLPAAYRKPSLNGVKLLEVVKRSGRRRNNLACRQLYPDAG